MTFGSGHLDWGVKACFRRYIEGPIAHGLLHGLRRRGEEPRRHDPLRAARRDLRDGARSGELQLHGSVRFTGHDAAGGPQLDLTLRDPRLVLAGDAATLHVDASSKALGSGTMQQFADVPLANVDLTGVAPTPLLDGLGFDALPSALTPAGVPVFAMYTAGVAMDPLSVVARYGVPRPLPEVDPPAQPPPAGPPPGPPAQIDPPPADRRRAGGRRARRDGALPRGRAHATVAIVTCRRGPCA